MEDKTVRKTKDVLLGLGVTAALIGILARHRRTADQHSVKRMRLDRRGTAFITGASVGMGAAFARLLAAQGYNLILGARREARLRDLADELERLHGIKAEVLTVDLSHPHDIERAEKRIEAADDTGRYRRAARLGRRLSRLRCRLHFSLAHQHDLVVDAAFAL